MNPVLSHQRLQRVCPALSSAGLIRMVSEIDDHGAIPSRALARTLTGLSTTQIRQAVAQADTLGLLDRSRSGLGLTPAGRDLADLYDATARWARHHNYPSRVSNFSERIRSVMVLLSEPTVTEWRQQDGDAAGLREVNRLLTEWADTHQQREHHQSAYDVAA
ncbi:hypothetical protein [Streptomyces sp. NPDC003247]|uniref:hypothetical protein n=1 Tax=Streptomyces sp. NPDC003247 TaxID=3364677 RepID=UPI0036A72CED